MSMLAELRRVSSEDLSRLRADPSDILWYLHGSEPYQPPSGLFSRLFRRQRQLRQRPHEWVAPPEDALLRLDQSWHAVHFLLTGSSGPADPPAGYLLSGGVELGDVDVGYGPARALLPEMEEDFARYIAVLPEAEARDRCTPEAMAAAEIYGAVRSPEEFPHLWSLITDLRSFLLDSAAAGDSAIVYIY